MVNIFFTSDVQWWHVWDEITTKWMGMMMTERFHNHMENLESEDKCQTYVLQWVT